MFISELRIPFVVSCALILSSIFSVSAQNDSIKKDYVEDVFANTQLINVQTTKMFPKGGFELKIQHRFGVIGADSSIYH